MLIRGFYPGGSEPGNPQSYGLRRKVGVVLCVRKRVLNAYGVVYKYGHDLTIPEIRWP